jgi:alkylation response protein AidB-like acyl-CoA dehydrogenase
MSTMVSRYEELIQQAREIGPLLNRDAVASEEQGALTQASADALIEAGFFGMMAPRELGGDELSALEWVQVLEELGRVDAIAGWVMQALSSHAGAVGSALPDSGVEKLYANGIPRIAGMPAPRGKAERVEGGVQFTGKHQFASGASLSTHFIAGGIVHEGGKPVVGDNGVPHMVAVIVPREQVREMGNWDVNGMEGTASIDYEVGPLFVPDDMLWWLNPWAPENPRGARYWQIGVDAAGPAGHTPIALGMAQRALEEIAVLAPTRKRIDATFPTVADQPTFLHDLALREAELRAARLYFHDIIVRSEAELIENGGPLRHDLAQRVKQASRLAHDVALRCVDFAYEWSGSAGLRKGHVIGRLFRNMHAINQHVVLDRNILVLGAPSIMQDLSASRGTF